MFIGIRIRQKLASEIISSAGIGFILGYVLPPHAVWDGALGAAIWVAVTVLFDWILQRRIRRTRAEAKREYREVQEAVERERHEESL